MSTDDIVRTVTTSNLEWHAIERPRKVLKTNRSDLDLASSLEGVLKIALPDKEEFFAEWIKALAHPNVCIASLDDVRRLGPEDIPALPVPPIVKGIFRQILAAKDEKIKEQQAVLDSTAARARTFLSPLKDRHMQPPAAGSKYFQEQKYYRLILTSEEVQAGVRVVAHRIETWCKGERIILVGILKGAFMFMSDLCRVMNRPYSVYFVEASSYKEGRTQGNLTVCGPDVHPSKFMDSSSKKPHKIVLIDELLDNGKTMQDMKLHFLDKLKDSHTDNDILTVCLFSKDRPRECPEADVTGIPNLPDLWLIGYGLDDRGTKRGWTELFAVPKVKIVGTIEQEDVQKLLDNLEDNAMLKSPHVFNGFELTHNSKMKYRVSGIDTQTIHDRSKLSLQGQETQVKSKADILKALDGIHVVKGKYEHDVLFAFIADNVALVPEDEIFYGNNQVYARMRCRLRKSIEGAARRCGVSGIAQLSNGKVQA
jgi:hypoxanthine phosphoribosyltransferase